MQKNKNYLEPTIVTFKCQKSCIVCASTGEATLEDFNYDEVDLDNLIN